MPQSEVHNHAILKTSALASITAVIKMVSSDWWTLHFNGRYSPYILGESQWWHQERTFCPVLFLWVLNNWKDDFRQGSLHSSIGHIASLLDINVVIDGSDDGHMGGYICSACVWFLMAFMDCRGQLYRCMYMGWCQWVQQSNGSNIKMMNHQNCKPYWVNSAKELQEQWLNLHDEISNYNFKPCANSAEAYMMLLRH